MDGKRLDGSVASSFQFVGYKIDKIDFAMTPTTNNLVVQKSDVSVEFGIAFRDVLKFYDQAESVAYVAGLAAKITMTNGETALASGEFSISGIFTSEGKFSKEAEQNLARYQAPTILFPYLRAAMTNILASSGFDSIVLPLINVAATAKSADVKIVDNKAFE